MSDEEAKQLLLNLWKYVTNEHPDSDMAISVLAEDLLSSLDVPCYTCETMVNNIKGLLSA